MQAADKHEAIITGFDEEQYLPDKDLRILEDYRQAFGKYSGQGVIDLDEKLKIKFNFQIHRLSDLYEIQKSFAPNRQSQYFIVLVQTGKGKMSVGQHTFAIVPDMLFVIPQRAVYSAIDVSSDIAGYFLSFSSDFFLQNGFPKRHIISRNIFKSSVKPYVMLNRVQLHKVLNIFKPIFIENNQNLPKKNELIAIKTLELLIISDRFFEQAQNLPVQDAYSHVVNKFNELIEKNFKAHREVGFYARALHTHPNHLTAAIKASTGFTAKETIINHIILEAKSLLASSQLSNKEIASELGFDHTEHFYALFKKVEKITPSQYRGKIG